jgi:outer membrane usher protein
MATRRRKTSRRYHASAKRLLPLLLLSSLTSLAAQAQNVAAVSSSLVAASAEENLAGNGGSDLYLELSLNGNPQGLVHFGLRGKELWAAASTLRQLGFVLPPDVADPVPLKSLPGVKVDYDAATQRVSINASADVLRLPTTVVDTSTLVAQKAVLRPACCSTTTFTAPRAGATRPASTR